MKQYLISTPVNTRLLRSRSLIGAKLLCSMLLTICFEGQSFAQPSGTEETQSSALPLPDQGPMLSDETGVKAGQWSMAFSLPFGGEAHPSFEGGVSSLGIWKMLSDEIALGMLAGLKISTEEVSFNSAGTVNQSSVTETKERVSSELILSPSFKFYSYQKGPIALFFIGQTHFRLYSDGDQATTTDKEPGVGETYSPAEDLQLRARLGFGSEWFPTPSFSLAGHIGLQVDLFRQGSLGMGLETFTSNLSAQLYF